MANSPELAPAEKDLYKIVAAVKWLLQKARETIDAVVNFVGDSGSGGTAGLVPAPPSGSAAAGKFLSADGTFALPAAQYKSGSFTRDMTAASGNASVTGVGFVPKAIFMIANVNGTARASWGFTTGTPAGQNVSIFDDSGDAADTYAIAVNNAVYLETGGANNQKLVLASFDSDGFTVTWTKTGAPTGTGTIMYVAMR